MNVLQHLVARERQPGKWGLYNRVMNRWVGLNEMGPVYDSKEQCIAENSGPFGSPSSE